MAEGWDWPARAPQPALAACKRSVAPDGSRCIQWGGPPWPPQNAGWRSTPAVRPGGRTPRGVFQPTAKQLRPPLQDHATPAAAKQILTPDNLIPFTPDLFLVIGAR